MCKVWIWIETHRGQTTTQTAELFYCAKNAIGSAQIEALLIGDPNPTLYKTLFSFGADRIINVHNPRLEQYHEEEMVEILAQLAIEHRPDMILFASTINGQSLAPWLAYKLNVPFAGESHAFTFHKHFVTHERFTWSGSVLETTQVEAEQHILLIKAKTYPAIEPRNEVSGDVIHIPYEKVIARNLKTKVLDSNETETSSLSLESANIIVAGGRGMGGPEGFQLIYELADTIGAAVGATRAVVDAGWIPYEHQIGQTGKTVSPDLYIACGISGAVQHLSGMQTSDVIVAINNDPEAPIFQIATYGIVGDVRHVLPLMTSAFRSALKQ